MEICYSPLVGKAVNLDHVADEMFSQRMLGDGMAIAPEAREVYSPVAGEITMVYETQHAIGIKTETGIETPNRTFPCWKRLKVLIIPAHGFMLPMYPAYGSSAESEGDGQPPSDSERRRWYAGCPNLFLELSRCAPVTGTGQTAHDFNFPIHYRRSQNRDGINRVLDRLISIWILVISL